MAHHLQTFRYDIDENTRSERNQIQPRTTRSERRRRRERNRCIRFFAPITFETDVAGFTINMLCCTIRTCRSTGAGPGVAGTARGADGGGCATAGSGGPVRLATAR